MNIWLLGALGAAGAYLFLKKPNEYKDGPFAVKLIPGPAGVVWMLGYNGAIAAQGTESTDESARAAAHAKALDLQAKGMK